MELVADKWLYCVQALLSTCISRNFVKGSWYTIYSQRIQILEISKQKLHSSYAAACPWQPRPPSRQRRGVIFDQRSLRCDNGVKIRRSSCSLTLEQQTELARQGNRLCFGTKGETLVKGVSLCSGGIITSALVTHRFGQSICDLGTTSRHLLINAS